MATATSNPLAGRLRYVPYVVRRRRRLARADVVHVHYGTSVRLIKELGMPRRPYALTLHGTDIRKQWLDPDFHDEMQRAIDESAHVFYANVDNQGNAVAARPDAEFLPSFVDVPSLPSWNPESVRPRIVFISRWDDDKGAHRQLELVEALAGAVAGRAVLTGLDWGPAAGEARRLGVDLLPRLSQPRYHQVLSRAVVGIGQASDYFSTSEFEALCMGLPVAALGSRLPRPDDGSVPPVMQGSVPEVVEQVVDALSDPVAVSDRLAGRDWARSRYDAEPYLPRLAAVYRQMSGSN